MAANLVLIGLFISVVILMLVTRQVQRADRARKAEARAAAQDQAADVPRRPAGTAPKRGPGPARRAGR